MANNQNFANQSSSPPHSPGLSGVRSPLVVVIGRGRRHRRRRIASGSAAAVGQAAEQGKVPGDLATELPRVTSQPRRSLNEDDLDEDENSRSSAARIVLQSGGKVFVCFSKQKPGRARQKFLATTYRLMQKKCHQPGATRQNFLAT